MSFAVEEVALVGRAPLVDSPRVETSAARRAGVRVCAPPAAKADPHRSSLAGLDASHQTSAPVDADVAALLELYAEADASAGLSAIRGRLRSGTPHAQRLRAELVEIAVGRGLGATDPLHRSIAFDALSGVPRQDDAAAYVRLAETLINDPDDEIAERAIASLSLAARPVRSTLRPTVQARVASTAGGSSLARGARAFLRESA